MPERHVERQLGHAKARLEEHGFWLAYLSAASACSSPVGIHLAVFAEPFLSLVLDGRKTIESRFSRVRCAPFGHVSEGDIILVKEVAGPVCGIALARRAWFYDLVHEPLDRIRQSHGDSICGDDGFWESRRGAAFATLIELAETTAISPFPYAKRDRRGWVSLRSRQRSLFL